MAAMSNTLVQNWLDHFFLNSAIANVGDVTGLPGSTTAGSLYVNLYSALPTKSVAGTIVSYTGYTEYVATRDGGAAGWSRTAERMSNVGTMNFGQRTNSGAAVVSLGWGVSRSSGATQPDFFGPHYTADSFIALCDDSLSADVLIAPGHPLADNDEVIVLPAEGTSLPSGLSAGTIYYVVSATASQNFKLSASLGGAAINIGDGVIRCAKTVTASIGELQTPKINAGDLIVYG